MNAYKPDADETGVRRDAAAVAWLVPVGLVLAGLLAGYWLVKALL